MALPYPTPRSPAVSAVMRANRKVGTKPEVKLRSLLHRRGMRFRKNFLVRADALSTRPDIVFPKAKLAVFVDGCFWHACPEHGTSPRHNAEYWTPKLARNVARDAEVTAALERDGWVVVRVWEHVEPITAAELVEAAFTTPAAG